MWNRIAISLLASIILSVTLQGEEAKFDAVHRAALAVRTRLTTNPSPARLDEAREQFETELLVAKAKAKTAREKAIYQRFDGLREQLSTLSYEWKLTEVVENAVASKAEADLAVMTKMSEKIQAALRAIDDASEFYTKPVAAKPVKKQG
jgi:hypothetical protein